MARKEKKKSNHTLLKAAAIGAAASAYYYAKTHVTYREEEVVIKSDRSTNIYASVIAPNTFTKMPLVIFCHGFNSSRNNTPMYRDLGLALANSGIASIRLDFSGCGDSLEETTSGCLTNNIMDIDACYKYMLEKYSIDKKHLALCGHSLGGRRALVYSSFRKEFKTLCLLAPAIGQGFDDLEDMFEGKENLEKLMKEAEEKGSVLYRDPDNMQLQLSDRFFKDMYKFDTYRCLSEFEGNILYYQGAKDTVVIPEISGKALQNINPEAKVNYVYLDNTGHDFEINRRENGIYDRVFENCVKYLIKNI